MTIFYCIMSKLLYCLYQLSILAITFMHVALCFVSVNCNWSQRGKAVYCQDNVAGDKNGHSYM